MSANVESMVYVREAPWHGLGTRVEEALTSADALKLAGLDWTVEQKDIAVAETGDIIPNRKANIRSTDGAVLGVVTDSYKVIQNTEAFAFTDALVEGEAKYETAGSLQGGKRIWLLAQLGEQQILGDKTEQYLCFTNNHDGQAAVRACVTPVRVVCQNTLNFALSTAKRSWSMVHTGDIKYKIAEAEQCLELGNKYMAALSTEAEKLANTAITNDKLRAIVNDLFPIKEDATEREQNNMKKLQEEFMICYYAPDIRKFQGTGWAVVNAAADMAGHTRPIRETKNYAENNFARILSGHYITDKAYAAVR